MRESGHLEAAISAKVPDTSYLSTEGNTIIVYKKPHYSELDLGQHVTC